MAVQSLGTKSQLCPYCARRAEQERSSDEARASRKGDESEDESRDRNKDANDDKGR